LKVYFDTSAIVKLLIDERGSMLATEFWHGSHVRVASQIAYPETRAALRQAVASRRIGPTELATAIEHLDRLWSQALRIGLDAGLARDAGAIADRYSLRGADAVHLATALASRKTGERMLMSTWDSRLADAAFDAGFSIVRE
jgi:predicted nucleic acid-binding protein